MDTGDGGAFKQFLCGVVKRKPPAAKAADGFKFRVPTSALRV